MRFLQSSSCASILYHILRRWLPRSQGFGFSLVPKILTFYMTWRSSTRSTAPPQPKRAYRITHICLQWASMHETQTEFCTQAPALLYINLYSERDPKLVTFSYSSNQWSIYVGSFRFLIHHPNPLPILLYSRLGLCQRERNEWDKTKVWVLMALKKVEFHQWFFAFIFISKQHIITWPRVKSLILEHAGLTLSPSCLPFTV